MLIPLGVKCVLRLPAFLVPHRCTMISPAMDDSESLRCGEHTGRKHEAKIH